MAAFVTFHGWGESAEEDYQKDPDFKRLIDTFDVRSFRSCHVFFQIEIFRSKNTRGCNVDNTHHEGHFVKIVRYRSSSKNGGRAMRSIFCGRGGTGNSS